MKKSVGIICCDRWKKEDAQYLKSINKKLIAVPIYLEKQYEIEDLTKMTKKCKVIFNNANAEPVTTESMELTKTFEEMGKKVIDSSHSYYYEEDKWMFYLKCLEHKLPTPKTELISREGHNPKKINELLKTGPLVLKAIFSDKGLCVEKVSDYREFTRKLKKIIKKNPSSPIIAQGFLANDNRSYRVTLIGFKVVQGIVKIGKNWKQTGEESKEVFRKFHVDEKLRKICEKTARVLGMDVCGLDLVKNKGKWYIIEANSSPHFGFIKSDAERLTDLLAAYLYKLA